MIATFMGNPGNAQLAGTMDEWRAPCHGDPRAPSRSGAVLFPCLPGRRPALPYGFEVVLVAQRVHRLPVAIVNEGGELAIAGEAFQRLPFPKRCIAMDAVQCALLQHVKSAVDVTAVAGRLLDEARDAVAVEDDCAETTR